jgi:hypothetical protein
MRQTSKLLKKPPLSYNPTPPPKKTSNYDSVFQRLLRAHAEAVRALGGNGAKAATSERPLLLMAAAALLSVPREFVVAKPNHTNTAHPSHHTTR